jgi:hypothetical protein
MMTTISSRWILDLCGSFRNTEKEKDDYEDNHLFDSVFVLFSGFCVARAGRGPYCFSCQRAESAAGGARQIHMLLVGKAGDWV